MGFFVHIRPKHFKKIQKQLAESVDGSGIAKYFIVMQ